MRMSCSWPRARRRDTKGPRQPRALWGHSPGPIPKTFYSMGVIADTCRPGSETSRPVLSGAANDPKILVPDLFRSDLLRQFCYRWLLWIDDAPSDRCRARWHLDHVSPVKRGLCDWWRSRSHLVDLLSIRLDFGARLPIKFARRGCGRNGCCPFQMYDLAIDNSVMGQA
jgi:hypothetical protein